jgi:hypothetical protein
MDPTFNKVTAFICILLKVVNFNEVTNRVIIELVCNMTIKPQEVVSVNDIENI